MAGPYHDRFNPYDYNDPTGFGAYEAGQTATDERMLNFEEEKLDRSGYSHGNQLGSSHYTFPLDLDSDENGHIINFYFLRRIDSDGNLVDKRGNGGDIGLLKRNGESVLGRKYRGAGRLSSAKSILANSKLSGAGGKGQQTLGNYLGGTGFGQTARTNQVVSMYMPTAPTATYTHNYTSAVTGGILASMVAAGAGGALAEAAKAAIELGKAAVTGGQIGIGTVNAFLSKMGKTASDMGETGKNILRTEAGKALGAINKAGQAVLGTIYNPRLEFLYESTAPRTFQYTFVMTPSNEDEANQIHKICQLFKAESAPAMVPDTKGSFLRYPSEVDIVYHSYNRENAYLNRISTCVCSSVGVDYNTEGQYRTFRPNSAGAPPVTTTLTLGFTETEMLTRERINEGF